MCQHDFCINKNQQPVPTSINLYQDMHVLTCAIGVLTCANLVSMVHFAEVQRQLSVSDRLSKNRSKRRVVFVDAEQSMHPL